MLEHTQNRVYSSVHRLRRTPNLKKTVQYANCVTHLDTLLRVLPTHDSVSQRTITPDHGEPIYPTVRAPHTRKDLALLPNPFILLSTIIYTYIYSLSLVSSSLGSRGRVVCTWSSGTE